MAKKNSQTKWCPVFIRIKACETILQITGSNNTYNLNILQYNSKPVIHIC